MKLYLSMSKKLTFYNKYFRPIITPSSKIDFSRREKYSKYLSNFNLILLSCLLWLMLWQLIWSAASVFFEYDLWRFLELVFSIWLTYLFINPLSKKLSNFSKSFSTNFWWFIIQVASIIYLLHILWSWIQKIEQKTK